MQETKKDYTLKLKEIKGFIDTGKTAVFGTIINTSKLNVHLDELKQIVEEQLNEATSIISREQSIIQEAHEEATRIIEDAQVQVMNQDIAHQAEEYARDLVFQAQEEAKEKIRKANDIRQKMLISSHKYLENLFDELQKQLEEQQEIIAGNRDDIRQSLQKKLEILDTLPK